MLRSLREMVCGVWCQVSGTVAPRVMIWTLVGLLAINAAQMVFTAWLYAESFKLQAKAAELVFLSTVNRQLHAEIDCAKVTAKR